MTISLEEHVAREPELLPCPFCGSRMLFRAALWPSDGDRDGFIHAEPTECPLGDFSDGSSDRSIIGKWNARAAIAAVHELEEAEKRIPKRNYLEEDCDELDRRLAPDPAEAMRAKLRPLAKQALTEEMDVETLDGADYEYAYNEMVRQVRAAISPPSPEEHSHAGKEGR